MAQLINSCQWVLKESALKSLCEQICFLFVLVYILEGLLDETFKVRQNSEQLLVKNTQNHLKAGKLKKTFKGRPDSEQTLTNALQVW